MNSIRDTAERFFEACEAGRGWKVCSKYCHPAATGVGAPLATAEVAVAFAGLGSAVVIGVQAFDTTSCGSGC